MRRKIISYQMRVCNEIKVCDAISVGDGSKSVRNNM